MGTTHRAAKQAAIRSSPMMPVRSHIGVSDAGDDHRHRLPQQSAERFCPRAALITDATITRSASGYQNTPVSPATTASHQEATSAILLETAPPVRQGQHAVRRQQVAFDQWPSNGLRYLRLCDATNGSQLRNHTQIYPFEASRNSHRTMKINHARTPNPAGQVPKYADPAHTATKGDKIVPASLRERNFVTHSKNQKLAVRDTNGTWPAPLKPDQLMPTRRACRPSHAFRLQRDGRSSGIDDMGN
ncbi:MAG: hypothetical protein H7A49_10735 [Akkermansiaceae bacterium]|nr:hypothetical protein [Akkermansiaceae bacterium]